MTFGNLPYSDAAGCGASRATKVASSVLDLCFLCFLAALIASSVETCGPVFGPSSARTVLASSACRAKGSPCQCPSESRARAESLINLAQGTLLKPQWGILPEEPLHFQMFTHHPRPGK